MIQKAERKFGIIPEWAQTGPISLRNYPFRVELHCSTKTGARAGSHPTIMLESAEFPGWQQYFEQHLGGRPTAFKMLLGHSIEHMSVPEQVPQWFDPSFEPDPRWRSSWPEYTARDITIDRLWNTLLHSTAPQYSRVLEQAQTIYPEPSCHWRTDPKGRGIWVPHAWVVERQITTMRGTAIFGAIAREVAA